jgi:hypothetical protein
MATQLPDENRAVPAGQTSCIAPTIMATQQAIQIQRSLIEALVTAQRRQKWAKRLHQASARTSAR